MSFNGGRGDLVRALHLCPEQFDVDQRHLRPADG